MQYLKMAILAKNGVRIQCLSYLDPTLVQLLLYVCTYERTQMYMHIFPTDKYHTETFNHPSIRLEKGPEKFQGPWLYTEWLNKALYYSVAMS